MKKGRVLYPGSFDPMTLGHLDIIQRAAQLFDEVFVGIAVNTSKRPLLTVEQRQKLLSTATAHLANVRIAAYQGMTVEYAHSIGAQALLRGLRNPSDFQFEFQMAITNRALATDLETVFFPSAPHYTFINSSLVREVAASGGDIALFVPASIKDSVSELLKSEFAKRRISNPGCGTQNE